MADSEIKDLPPKSIGASNDEFPINDVAGGDLTKKISMAAIRITNSQVTDFASGVSSNAAVAANTAKVSNATHTGEVIGSTSLSVDKSAITGKTAKATPVLGDFILISDGEDSDNLKKVDVTNLPGGGSSDHGALTGLGDDDHTQYQLRSEKNSANGYVGLDGSSKITGSQQTYGALANTACEGNDSRLSDARTPLAHATTHQSGGSDPIKLDDLATPDDNTDLDATASLHGLMSKADKSKLDGVDANANNYVHPSHSGDVISAGDGNTAIASEVIVNSDVNPSAAIEYSKLDLTNGIVNGDINAAAAIAYSKLNLTAGIVPGDLTASFIGELLAETTPTVGHEVMIETGGIKRRLELSHLLNTNALLSGLGDTSISSPATGNILVYAGGWLNRAMGGDGSLDSLGSLTISNDAVTYAKMQNVSATSRILGRASAGAGIVEELTAAQVKTILGITTPPNFVLSSFNDEVMAGTTEYAVISGHGTFDGPEKQKEQDMPNAGRFQGMQVRVDSNTHDVATTFTLRKNGADANQTVTIGSSTSGTFRDSTNTDDFVQDDTITYKADCTGRTSGAIRFRSAAMEVVETP